MLKYLAILLTLLTSMTTLTAGSGIYKSLSITKTTFAQLPSWQKTSQKQSFHALKRSCAHFLKIPASTTVGTLSFPMTVKRWLPLCKAAMKLRKVTPYTTRRFFQHWFQPVALNDHDTNEGFFTGYFLPQINVSYKYSKKYHVPIYARPPNLVTAKLGMFRMDLKGVKLAARLRHGRLYPYRITRAQINRGALKNKAKVLVYAEHYPDRFFLQTQGSGIAILPNGKRVLLAYNGDNGQNYYPIGRWFLAHHEVIKKYLSMQNIYQWLMKHPKRARKIMEMNKAFVFFQLLNTPDAIGTQGVPLTPAYSLAVDNNVIPLGFPIWLTTRVPNPKDLSKTLPFNRLMLAQDTGGAIKGVIRGDIYFGTGKTAALQAGGMKHRGKVWLLLPKTYYQQVVLKQ